MLYLQLRLQMGPEVLYLDVIGYLGHHVPFPAQMLHASAKQMVQEAVVGQSPIFVDEAEVDHLFVDALLDHPAAVEHDHAGIEIRLYRLVSHDRLGLLLNAFPAELVGIGAEKHIPEIHEILANRGDRLSLHAHVEKRRDVAEHHGVPVEIENPPGSEYLWYVQPRQRSAGQLH